MTRIVRAILIGLMTAAASALAQQYPARPVRLVVGFVPGGVNDIVARLTAHKLNEARGQPFVVENRAGAGGTIGADYVAKSKPDGYTMLLASVSNLVVATNQYRLPHDPQKDFAPISLVGAAPNVLVVHPSLPARTRARTRRNQRQALRDHAERSDDRRGGHSGF